MPKHRSVPLPQQRSPEQMRAPAGGMLGLNGEYYAGGRFLPTTQLPSRSSATSHSGRVMEESDEVDVFARFSQFIGCQAGVWAPNGRPDRSVCMYIHNDVSVGRRLIRAACTSLNSGRLFLSQAELLEIASSLPVAQPLEDDPWVQLHVPFAARQTILSCWQRDGQIEFDSGSREWRWNTRRDAVPGVLRSYLKDDDAPVRSLENSFAEMPPIERATLLAMVLERAQSHAVGNGYCGNCASAAVAINQVILRNEGQLVFAANKSFMSKGVFFGHVAVMPPEGFLDDPSNYIDWCGAVRKEKIESWGELEHSDDEYSDMASELGIGWDLDAATETTGGVIKEAKLAEYLSMENVDGYRKALCRAIAGLGYGHLVETQHRIVSARKSRKRQHGFEM